MTTQASGCLFLSLDTGRVCMQLRSNKGSYANTWSFWGGKGEGDERPFETLLREVQEEAGTVSINRDKNFEYNAYVITVDKEFVPATNHETSGYVWTDVSYVPKPLHQGAKMVLQNEEMVRKIRTIVELHNQQTV
jgi:8-oxo-dGTP pyrophosphatase MutT (NUDIX family)